MSVSLKNKFLSNARGFTLKDANGITWAINSGTNEVTATYSGGGSSGAANPTAKVGLTAVNGSAATFMRSDAAPPIDQTIAPTWTNLHTYSAGITVSGAVADTAGLRATGVLSATTGAGVELAYQSGVGYVTAYDRTGAAYKTLTLRGSAITTTADMTVGGKFAANGGTPTAALSGFGSPTGGVTSNLSGSSTLAQTAGTLAALLAYLKTIGLVAA